MDNTSIRNLLYPAPYTPEERVLPSPTYSTQEAADLLGIHYKTLRNWMAQGIITPSHRAGRNIRFTHDDIVNRKPAPVKGRPTKKETE